MSLLIYRENPPVTQCIIWQMKMFQIFFKSVFECNYKVLISVLDRETLLRLQNVVIKSTDLINVQNFNPKILQHVKSTIDY